MSIMLERDQWVIVAHRVSGINEGSTWLVERPADDCPAVRRSTSCPVCAKPLTYTVHSVRATRGRRALRRAAAAVLLAVPVTIFGLLALGTPPDLGELTAPVAALGLGLGGLLGYGASQEMGMAGHRFDPRHTVLPTDPLP